MQTRKHVKAVAVIPARYESRRFPGKMLANLHGKPLIQHVYENAKKCQRLQDVVIATDDNRIFDCVNCFGGHAVLTPVECMTGTDRIVSAINKEPSLQDAELILNIQGDEPCMEPAVMTRVIEELESDPKAVMSTAIFRLQSEEEATDPHLVKCVKDHNNHAIYFSRGLIPYGHEGYDPSTTYYGHLGLYCYRKEFLIHYGELPRTPLQIAEDLEQLKVIENGYQIHTSVVESQSIGVDTPEDLKKVEQLLCQKNTFSSQEESAPHLVKD